MEHIVLGPSFLSEHTQFVSMLVHLSVYLLKTFKEHERSLSIKDEGQGQSSM